MRAKIGSLNNMPQRLRLIDEGPWGSQGIRKIIVKNYNIYYWIEDDSSTVYVIAVVYSKRNQVKVLSDILEE